MINISTDFLYYLAFAGIFLFLSGYAISRKLPVSISSQLLISPVIGYVLVQSIFFTVFLTKTQAKIALEISYFLCVPGLIWLVLDYRKILDFLTAHKLSIIKFAIIWCAVLTLLAWPIIFNSSSNPYWHSGADDLVRDVYAKANDIKYLNLYESEFIGHVLQYTSPSFWLSFFDENSIRVVIVNYLILLFMMYGGIFVWARKVLQLSVNQALFLAVVSICSTFYTASYFNYHAGTMMVLAMIFHVLTLIASFGQGTNKQRLLSAGVIISIIIFLIFSYHVAALVFYLAPLLLLLFYQYISVRYGATAIFANVFRYKWILLLALYLSMVIAIYLIISSSQLYYFNNQIPGFDYPGYRAWELIRSPLFAAYYWGLMPSLLMGAGYPYISELANNQILYYFVIFISLLLFYPVFSYLKRYASGTDYLSYFLIFNIGSFFIFLVLLDPYFTYKLLYLTQTVFFAVSLIWWLRESRRLLKKIVLITFLGIATLNIWWNVETNQNIHARSYNNDNSAFEELKKIPKNILCNSVISIPDNELKIIYNAFWRDEQLCPYSAKKNDDYILYSLSKKDINYRTLPSPVFLGKHFVIVPKENFLLIKEEFNPAESDSSGEPVRQLYDRHLSVGSGKISYELNSSVDNRDCLYKFIQLDVSPGASRLAPLFKLKYIVAGETGSLDVFDRSLIYIPIENRCGKFDVKIFTDDDEMVSLLPREQRKLSAKITDLRLVKERYEPASLALLNPEAVASKANAFLFGSGWSEIESPEYRWSQGESEFYIKTSTTGHFQVTGSIVAGPSAQLPAFVEVIDSATGDRLSNIEVSYIKEKFSFAVDLDVANKIHQYKFRFVGNLKSIEDDKRLLAFRVFDVTVSDRN